MSHSSNERGLRSHVKPENHLKARLKRWPLRLLVVALLVAFASQRQPPDQSATALDGVAPGAVQEMAPSSTTAVAQTQTPSETITMTTEPLSVSEDPTTTTALPTTSTTTATTTTLEPMVEPVLVGVGSATAPADPVMTTATFVFRSEPQKDVPQSILTCHADTELHVFIPLEKVEVLVHADDRTYEVRTEAANYSAAAFGLACTLEDGIEGRGTVPDPTASQLYNLRDNDGKRTELASNLMEELAVTTPCVDSAEINIRQAAQQLLKEAFLAANPDIEAGMVTVSVNPPARSIKRITLPSSPDNPVEVLSTRCQWNA